jgi:hypothetical protein
MAQKVPFLAFHKAAQGDPAPPKHQAFYESPWFWAGVAAAAAAGGAFYLSRDTSPTMVHLQLSIPH